MTFSRQRSCSTSHGRLHSMHVNCSRTETDSGGFMTARLSRLDPASVQDLWKLWDLWKIVSLQPSTSQSAGCGRTLVRGQFRGFQRFRYIASPSFRFL